MDNLISFVVKETNPEIIYKLILLFTVIILAKVILVFLEDSLNQQLKRFDLNNHYFNLFVKSLKYLIWIVVIVFILRIMGLSEMAIILGGAITAITSLIMVKIFSEYLDDILAGIVLLLDEKIKIGMTINFQELNGQIISFGILKTTLQDDDNNIYLIPNSLLKRDIITLPGNKKY